MFPRLKFFGKMNRLFKNKTVEVNPTVLVRQDHPSKNEFTFSKKKLVGVFFRVAPSTAKEVLFIQGLPKNSVVYTPDEGDGLIISPSCLKGME
tara:strand:+ start:131 stop:409 length:279 start_codon:yes stop_codon:yes gene_type:complete